MQNRLLYHTVSFIMENILIISQRSKFRLLLLGSKLKLNIISFVVSENFLKVLFVLLDGRSLPVLGVGEFSILEFLFGSGELNLNVVLDQRAAGNLGVELIPPALDLSGVLGSVSSVLHYSI